MADFEVWLSGPVGGVPPYLQPAAHALLQARAEVDALAPSVDVATLWRRTGTASAGFHVLHLAGALDRICAYARGDRLTDAQKAAARAEAEDHPELDGAALAAIVSAAVDRALEQVRATDPSTLLDERKIGRAGLPSTVIGCLFHAAEHSTRHAGQFISSVKILQAIR